MLRAQASSYCLEAPSSYFEASITVVNLICNGCGTDGWKGYLVPETVYGLSIAAACQIHDWDYAHGETANDKVLADKQFLRNMLKLVVTQGGMLQYLRVIRVYGYYLSVKTFGNAAYWKGKERS